MNVCKHQLQRAARTSPLMRRRLAPLVQSFHSTAMPSADAAAAVVETGTQEEAAAGDPEPSESIDIVWTTDRLDKDQIAKVDAIFHKILWLDVVETGLLTASINFKLGRTLNPKQNAAIERQLETWALGGGGGAAEETEEEAVEEGPKVVDLKLTGFDAKAKIKVIKEVRSIAGLGLKEAKELVEGAPAVIQKDLKPEQAEELKAQLEAIGATVEIS